MDKGSIRILGLILASLLAATLALSLIVFFRAAEWLAGNHLLDVFVWQLATWAPWMLFGAGINLGICDRGTR